MKLKSPRTEYRINEVEPTLITEIPIDSTQAPVHYVQAEQIGHGMSCKCYKFVRVCKDKKVFAGKVISRDFLKDNNKKVKLEMEIRIQGMLKHPNIVRMEHFFEDEANIYILMELCENQSLH